LLIIIIGCILFLFGGFLTYILLVKYQRNQNTNNNSNNIHNSN